MPLSDAIDAMDFAWQLLYRPKLWFILAVLNAIPILNLIALGYFARVAAELPEEPPPLRPLGRAFILGLKVLVVALAYGILLFIIAAVIGAAAFFTSLLSPSAELLIVAAAVATAVVLLAALGVPIALIIAARRGVLVALNPVNSWRTIRRAGIVDYLAYLAAMVLIGLLSILPTILLAHLDFSGYIISSIVLFLAAPLIGAFLWYWGGLIVQRAEAEH